MRLFIDDIREPSFVGWSGQDILVARTSEEAIDQLNRSDITITEISFDHDLGGDDTGYLVACWIEEATYEDAYPQLTWQVHSANPVGRKRIADAMQSADRYHAHKDTL